MSVFFFFAGLFARSDQCTREVLEEYYINLVRTDSSGRFFIPGSPTGAESTVSSESDPESMASRSPSPMPGSPLDHRIRLTASMRSPTATRTPQAPQVPTLEQNMAFADLQSSLGGGSDIPFGRP